MNDPTPEPFHARLTATLETALTHGTAQWQVNTSFTLHVIRLANEATGALELHLEHINTRTQTSTTNTLSNLLGVHARDIAQCIADHVLHHAKTAHIPTPANATPFHTPSERIRA